ncbi:MAG: shikimate kinase [Candidatus Omnitrophica bacterium]|nr:shikimate kinase [Candidatus Omnitrophota bacterium]
MKNIYLVGMMGSGKTETARALAALLGSKAVDLDALITERERRGINEIFDKEGESYFRDVESRILSDLSIKKNLVIATGGGTVLRESNRKALLQTGKVFYLETSLVVLWERLKMMRDRPLLQSAEPRVVLERILEERQPLYEVFENRVTTDYKTPDEVAREISKILVQHDN